jgi:hypothetical protein
MVVPSGRETVSTADAGRIWRYSVLVSGWADSKRGVYLNGGGGAFVFFFEGEVLVTSILLLSEESHRREHAGVVCVDLLLFERLTL